MSTDHTPARRKPCLWPQFEAAMECFVTKGWTGWQRWSLVRGTRRMPGQSYLETTLKVPAWMDEVIARETHLAVEDTEEVPVSELLEDEECTKGVGGSGSGSGAAAGCWLHFSIVWHATFASPALFMRIADPSGQPIALPSVARALGERLSQASDARRFSSVTLEVTASAAAAACRPPLL